MRKKLFSLLVKIHLLICYWFHYSNNVYLLRIRIKILILGIGRINRLIIVRCFWDFAIISILCFSRMDRILFINFTSIQMNRKLTKNKHHNKISYKAALFHSKIKKQHKFPYSIVLSIIILRASAQKDNPYLKYGWILKNYITESVLVFALRNLIRLKVLRQIVSIVLRMNVKVFRNNLNGDTETHIKVGVNKNP